MKRYLITSALPYANGPIHFGHLVGAYIPADVYTRHKKMQGENAIHISGSDEHGVAIIMGAQKAKKSCQDYVNDWHEEHKKLFDLFDIHFDYFGQTSAEYHHEEVLKWFEALNEKGLIGPKDTQQLFCKSCENHLPDRFVEGECYECGYKHARGDECPNCGILIDPTKLINPVCKICGAQNSEEVTVTQWYLLQSKFHDHFKDWLKTKKNNWRKTVYPFVEALTEKGLHDRAITRDLDWGIDVPLAEAKGKKLYVWFDAPIGYVSNTKQLFKETGSKEDYLKDWWKNPDTEIIHFVGKDNIIFHTVIFPVMGMGSGRINPPSDVPANQFLNLEGKQFSKSSGWYVDIEEAFKNFGVDSLRYYLLSILPETSDSSFAWKEFGLKVNGELANNIGNLVNRCLKFWKKNWSDGLEAEFFQGFSESDHGKAFKEALDKLHECLDQKQIRKGLEQLMNMGQMANTYFSDQEPWAQFKTEPEKAAKTIAQSGIQIFILGVLFSPFLPSLSGKILSFFDLTLEDKIKQQIYRGDWSVLDTLFKEGGALKGKPKALVPKIEDDVIQKLTDELHQVK